MKKIIETTILTVCAIITIWVTLSCIEVMSLNSRPNPNYSDWNIFEQLF